MNVFSKKPAFSLVELLMALLVASLLLAALAPVMTKKYMDNVNIVGSPGSAGVRETLDCFTTDNLEYVLTNNDYVGLILASGGGGGAGTIKADPRVESVTMPAGSVYTKTLKLEKNMDNFSITRLIGGGGGGGRGEGYYNLEDKDASPETCAAINGTDTTGHSGNYATYDEASDLCVTKYNQVSNPNTYTTASITAWDTVDCTSKYDHPSSNCNNNQNNMAYPYGGCNRPVCTHAGAVKACEVLADKTGAEGSTTRIKWDLPKYTDLQKWGNSYTTLALCTTGGDASHSIRSQVAYCNASSNQLYSGNPFSVRCVVGAVPTETFYSLSGGGGSSGGGILTPNSEVDRALNEVIKENYGGNLVVTAGAGGGGGVSGHTAGYNGGQSCVSVVGTDNNVKFTACVPGGNAGAGANTSGGGSGGSVISLNDCYYQKAGEAAKKFACSGNNTTNHEGGNGSKRATTDNTGGMGGASIADTSNKRAGFAAGDTTTIAGQTLSSVDYPGAGGSGGRTRKDLTVTSKFVVGNGGKGSDGVINITYNYNFNAAGGGGGAGGNVVIVPPMDIVRHRGECTCALHPGGGGAGGLPGYAGADGLASSFVCECGEAKSKVSFTVAGGKGGKLGTPQSQTVAAAAGGAGGAKASKSELIKIEGSSVTIKDSNLLYGLAGLDADFYEDGSSYGGNGGKSGIGTLGACGGYNGTEGCSYNDITKPAYSSAMARNAENKPTIPTLADFKAGTYGAGGAGGAGGGWVVGLDLSTDSGFGRGSNGMAGYVCVYIPGNEN